MFTNNAETFYNVFVLWIKIFLHLTRYEFQNFWFWTHPNLHPIPVTLFLPSSSSPFISETSLYFLEKLCSSLLCFFFQYEYFASTIHRCTDLTDQSQLVHPSSFSNRILNLFHLPTIFRSETLITHSRYPHILSVHFVKNVLKTFHSPSKTVNFSCISVNSFSRIFSLKILPYILLFSISSFNTSFVLSCCVGETSHTSYLTFQLHESDPTNQPVTHSHRITLP